MRPYYYRARYYDPAAARFLSEDPLRFSAIGFYKYVENNPARFADPTGLAANEGIARLVPSSELPNRFKLEGDLEPLCRKGRNFAADLAMLETSLATRRDEIIYLQNSKNVDDRLRAGDPGHLTRIDEEKIARARCKENGPDCDGEKKKAPDFVAPPEWTAQDTQKVAGWGLVGAAGAGFVYVVVNYWWVPVLAF